MINVLLSALACSYISRSGEADAVFAIPGSDTFTVLRRNPGHGVRRMKPRGKQPEERKLPVGTWPIGVDDKGRLALVSAGEEKVGSADSWFSVEQRKGAYWGSTVRGQWRLDRTREDIELKRKGKTVEVIHLPKDNVLIALSSIRGEVFICSPEEKTFNLHSPGVKMRSKKFSLPGDFRNLTPAHPFDACEYVDSQNVAMIFSMRTASGSRSETTRNLYLCIVDTVTGAVTPEHKLEPLSDSDGDMVDSSRDFLGVPRQGTVIMVWNGKLISLSIRPRRKIR